MQWIKQHLLIFVALVIVVVAGVWYGMAGSGQAPLISTEVVGGSGSPTADTENQELVETLLTLRAITLTGTIFTDPAFQSLKDFGTTIVPEAVGRANPFAPLPSQTRVSQPAATQTTFAPLKR
jgi:hypothetical protein